MKITVVVCNKCKDVTRPTRHYVVRLDSLAAEADLCSEHSEALDEILAEAPPQPSLEQAKATMDVPAAAPPKGRASRPRRRLEMVSLDDIDKMKES